MVRGLVFNIQHFSIQDGKGIRTTVFLKGCPLKCIWCANPESQRTIPELEYISSKCINCGNCMKCDPDHIASRDIKGDIHINVESARNAEPYRKVCPAQALQVMGDYMTVKDVIDQVEADSIFYRYSFGGMTLSGGEPLMQPDFSRELLLEAHRRYIDTSIETTGFASYENVRKVFAEQDSIIYDIKMFDPDKHRYYTGVGNEVILNNFHKMRKEFPDIPVLVRTPVIPGVNDDEEEITGIRNFISRYPNVSYELLKYHRLGQPKYESLGREYALGDIRLDDERFERLKELAVL